METCKTMIEQLQQLHEGTYISYLSKRLNDSLNLFESSLAVCLLDITSKFNSGIKSPRVTFRLKGLVESLERAGELMKSAVDCKESERELDRFMQNSQENKKLFIFIPEQKRSDLFMININKSKIDKVGVEELKDITNFASINIDKDIFISGGEDQAQLVLSHSFLLHMKSAHTLKKPNMHYPRSLHSFTLLNKNVYSLAGSSVNYYGRIYLKSVERYSLVKNTWTLCPSLGERKSNVAAVTFNERLIYCFGGFRKEGENMWLDAIEVLDGMDEEEGWKVVRKLGRRYDVGVCQVSNSEILVFGGCGKRFEWLRDSYIYNVYTKKLVEVEKNLKQPGKFAQCRCAKYKAHIYALDEEMQDIHLYSIHNQRWFLSPIAELYPTAHS
eukprot:TRINITY_DN13934_c0_g2_i15.p1 TRINITY_DN13934_c0_g2~~TRINITY_DN13934_c0_g2_i15.p1  ORF type:complete len:385 (-),score=83.70 TRINITY_DN13934_c0_g2_i15:92-1246(-)